jgi:KUP system potassium uptake protein
MADRSDAVATQEPRASVAAPPRAPSARGAALVLAALGVVFGDIGTSPLYAMQTVFSLDHGEVRPTPTDVYGIVSLIFWSVTVVVSIKYVGIVMRADNDGEGGVMALAALARRLYAGRSSKAGTLVVIGIVGVSLFYGDSLITPAISVLSAVEGLKVATPALSHVVVPAAAVILALLFAMQRYGTGRVGRLFGPITLLWFGGIGLAGIGQIVHRPSVLRGLSPSYAVSFAVERPFTAFLAMGAVVLTITGAEALYADMGHFGRTPIARAWFAVVFPALTLNYLGQASLILRDPGASASPFFLMLPSWSRWPMVLLATAATVIASQAVISGAFSLSRQAMQLGLLPPLNVRQTSEQKGGQIYLPGLNAALFVGVMVIVFGFRSSARLSTAYGVSVTGALVVDTLLMLLVARVLWKWRPWRLALGAVAFGGVELLFLTANLSKIAHGGWLPLLIAVSVFTVMSTWRRGREIVAANRRAKEGPLDAFVESVRADSVARVPGVAVFPHPGKETAPLALRATVQHHHVLHQQVIIVSATAANVPHVQLGDAFTYDDLGYQDDGIQHLDVKFGFADRPDIPTAVAQAATSGLLAGLSDVSDATYFVSRGNLRPTRAPGLARWRKALFLFFARNATDPARYFCLPSERTVVIGSDIDI